MTSGLTQDICALLEKSVNDTLENFDVTLDNGNTTGEGFTSDMCFVSLKKKSTGDDYHFIIKQCSPVSSEQMSDSTMKMYKNEEYFYSKLMPAMVDFQKSFKNSENFTHIPEFYAAGDKKIVLQNLKFSNYQLHPKAVPLNTHEYEKIFTVHGKLHGLAYAFKHHRPQEYGELITGLSFSLDGFFNENFRDLFKTDIMERVKKYLEDENEKEILKRMQKYIEEGIFDSCRRLLEYKGDYAILNHGDSWSNNIMFKYDSTGIVEDLKLLDFQLSNIGSPVFDLVYTLYSGASEEVLNDLKNLLRVYYDSLSKTLRELDCDPEKIYPYEELEKEWKEYGMFGYMMGLFIWAVKCMDDLSNVPDMEDRQGFIKPNDEKFKVRALISTRHMFKNGFL